MRLAPRSPFFAALAVSQAEQEDLEEDRMN